MFHMLLYSFPHFVFKYLYNYFGYVFCERDFINSIRYRRYIVHAVLQEFLQKCSSEECDMSSGDVGQLNFEGYQAIEKLKF